VPSIQTRPRWHCHDLELPLVLPPRVLDRYRFLGLTHHVRRRVFVCTAEASAPLASVRSVLTRPRPDLIVLGMTIVTAGPCLDALIWPAR